MLLTLFSGGFPLLCVVVGPSAGWTTPTAAEIKASTLAGGGAATWAGVEEAPTVSGAYDLSTAAANLAPGVSYRVAFVWTDGANDSNVVVTDAFTTARPVFFVCT